MRTSESLIEWLRGVVIGPLFHFHIAAEPMPTPRPRVSKFGAYFPKTYEVYRGEAQRQLAVQTDDRLTEDARSRGLLDGPLAVVLDVRCSKPRTGKLEVPRGDVDNYAKGPLDAATKVGLWRDDTQVAALGVSKRYVVGPVLGDAERDQEAGEAPGVSIYVGRLSA